MLISSTSPEIEQEILKNNLNYQNTLKKSLLKYIDEIASNSIDNFNSYAGEIAYNYLKKVKVALQKVDDNIAKITTLLQQLKSISEVSSNVDKSNLINDYNNNFFDYQKNISYNMLEIQKVINSLLDYVKFNFSTPSTSDILNTDLLIKKANINSSLPNEEIIINTNIASSNQLNINAPKEDLKAENNDSSVNKSTPSSHPNLLDASTLKENQLIISDIQSKVILPYSLLELENIRKQNTKYDSIQAVIDDLYTIPMSYYKNASLSRFKEAYNLVRKKSNGTIKEALDLGLELFFKYDLNPAIITACKNIDELDIYLACLDDGEPDNFKCFSIIYEVLPVIKKRKFFLEINMWINFLIRKVYPHCFLINC